MLSPSGPGGLWGGLPVGVGNESNTVPLQERDDEDVIDDRLYVPGGRPR